MNLSRNINPEIQNTGGLPTSRLKNAISELVRYGGPAGPTVARSLLPGFSRPRHFILRPVSYKIYRSHPVASVPHMWYADENPPTTPVRSIDFYLTVTAYEHEK